jgi:uncharacterized membrane protein
MPHNAVSLIKLGAAAVYIDTCTERVVDLPVSEAAVSRCSAVLFFPSSVIFGLHLALSARLEPIDTRVHTPSDWPVNM